MGDQEGARDILEEVAIEGNEGAEDRSQKADERSGLTGLASLKSWALPESC